MIARWRTYSGDADVNSWKWVKKCLGRRDGSVGGNLRYELQSPMFDFQWRFKFRWLNLVSTKKLKKDWLTKITNWFQNSISIHYIYWFVFHDKKKLHYSTTVIVQKDFADLLIVFIIKIHFLGFLAFVFNTVLWMIENFNIFQK